MVSATEVIAELLRRYEQDSAACEPNENDVAEWTGGSVETELIFYNDLAAELARGYGDGRYPFQFCDRVVNGLFAAAVSSQMRKPQPPWPKLFHRVYEAFDAGEYHRREDKSDDPVAEQTDPAIAAILRDL